MTRGKGWIPPDPFQVVQGLIVVLVLLWVVYSVAGALVRR